ncbi:hypothetical protein FRC07_013626, partial [Ceratobasidium sp. 392]
EKLQVILEGWGFWDEYSDELLDRIRAVLPESPPAPPKPTSKARFPRRKAQLTNKPPAGETK